MITRVAGAAVGLALVAGGFAAGGSEAAGTAAGTTYDELPVGAPTTLPWWQHRRLHVGATVIETRRSSLASRSGTTLVATSEDRRLGRPAQWYVVRGSRLEALPMESRADQPLISANGRWLAWLEVRAPHTDAYRRWERYRVVIFNVAHDRIARHLRDRRRVAWEDGVNALWLRTLSNRGRLLLTQGNDGVKVLSPGAPLARFSERAASSLAVPDGWPGGTTIYRRTTGASVYGTLGRGGRFSRVGSFTSSFAGRWSPSGSGFAYVDDDSRPTTYWVRPLDGEPVELAVPTDLSYPEVVGWESDDAVVLWSFDLYSSEPSSRLVRCSATTGACERVPGGPKATRPATMG